MIPYLVSQFAKSTITNLVRECFGYSFPDILKKPQVEYLYNYLGALGASSVVLEFDYLDKDYLEDFARYYVKRFGNDGHKCARLHFFSCEIDHGTITAALQGDEDVAGELKEGYLGFMVVKPLPITFIGKTCLKFREGVAGTALRRSYSVDLFGIQLGVDALAFQEQDKVVAACATTAIWSALHAISWIGTRRIPSCSEITMSAINYIDGSSNSFPNKELSNKQILRALDVQGLRHHAESVGCNPRGFASTVVASINSGLPVIITGKVVSETKGELGGHAVCIVGYSDLLARRDDVERVVYVHDDRLGPYVKAVLVADSSGFHLDLFVMLGKEWARAGERLVPDVIIIPSDKKARLPFFYVGNTCDVILEQAGYLSNDLEGVRSKFSYDVRLREISDIRQEVRTAGFCASKVDPVTGGVLPASAVEISNWQDAKVRFLTSSFARLQWVAQFYCFGHPAFKVLFDASDVPQGDAVSAVYFDSVELCVGVIDVLEDLGRLAVVGFDFGCGHFYRSFLSRISVVEDTLYSYLSISYGDLRAPKYLKEQEFKGGDIQGNPTRRVFYDSSEKGLSDLFPSVGDGGYLIWVIAADGALVVGKEIEVEVDGCMQKCGHPSITGFKPARIAGELVFSAGIWYLNSKSGRYSGDYQDSSCFLENAKRKFVSFFSMDRFELQ